MFTELPLVQTSKTSCSVDPNLSHSCILRASRYYVNRNQWSLDERSIVFFLRESDLPSTFFYSNVLVIFFSIRLPLFNAWFVDSREKLWKVLSLFFFLIWLWKHFSIRAVCWRTSSPFMREKFCQHATCDLCQYATFIYSCWHATLFLASLYHFSHVVIIMLHVKLFMLHVHMNKSHVNMNKLHVDMIISHARGKSRLPLSRTVDTSSV